MSEETDSETDLYGVSPWVIGQLMFIMTILAPLGFVPTDGYRRTNVRTDYELCKGMSKGRSTGRRHSDDQTDRLSLHMPTHSLNKYIISSFFLSES